MNNRVKSVRGHFILSLNARWQATTLDYGLFIKGK